MNDAPVNPSPPTLPDWLPDSVRAWIIGNWDHPDHLAGRRNIDVLAHSPQMQALWAVLQRYKAHSYEYPAQRLPIEHSLGSASNDEDELQGLGFILLFKHMLHLSLGISSAITNVEAESKSNEMRQRAEWLRQEAEDTDRLRQAAGGIDWRVVSQGMRDKADVLAQAASAIPVYRLKLKNQRPNMGGLGAATEISHFLKALFTVPLYKQSAALASMLTGEAVTLEQLRELHRKTQVDVTFFRQKKEKSHS
jgi:hypothetical protein